MADIIELLRQARLSPDILKDPARLASFTLTSAELDAVRKLDPGSIAAIIDAIEQRIRINPVADSQACTGGTFACSSAQGLSALGGLTRR